MSEVDVKSANGSAKRARRNKSLLSIRARLIVIALLAIAPLMIERVRGLERARAGRAQLALSQAMDLAHGGAAAQREIVSSMRALLQVVARAYTRMPSDEPGCNRALSELISTKSWVCSAVWKYERSEIFNPTPRASVAHLMRPSSPATFNPRSQDTLLMSSLSARLQSVSSDGMRV